MKNKFIISSSPHIHSGDTVPKKMVGVLIALIPAFLVALYFFGLGAFMVTLIAVLSCISSEYFIQKYILKKEVTITDGSALLTGVLLAFNLPSNLPVWIIVIGSIFAIGVGKMSFGGLGNNPFNPALVGRVFLMFSFPAPMSSWPRPMAWNTSYLDAETGATPLAVIKEYFGELSNLTDSIWGNIGGSLGEVSTVALLIGLAFLLIRKIITWHIPVSILASAFICAGLLHWVYPQGCVSPVIHLLTGGIMLGAIFMATDYVTSPVTPSGKLIYGVGIGVLTIVIRVFGVYPEGVSFAILIMNAFTPLINTRVKPKRFGGAKNNG
jgi:electron transport complex protein RnfD